MAKSAEELAQLSNELFKRQSRMLPLYQTLAENFYPERADFTNVRAVGSELADNLVDSYPILMRRDLCNSFSAMLRNGEWFRIGVDGEPDHLGRMWLDWASQRLMKLFNNRAAAFTRATKEADHDYGTFGNAVLTVERNVKADGLLFRNWHLKDCAWCDGVDGHVEVVTRKWAPTYYDLTRYFPEKALHKNMIEKARMSPFQEADVRHLVMPSAMAKDEELQERFAYVSYFIDMQNMHIIEKVGQRRPYYIIPRFQTIAGSPYAYSPATVAGLPDARTLQAMTFTLLEAGERYARPPIIATQRVIRGDIDLSPDGVTYVDDEYDERLGASLRTLQQDRGGFPIGLEMRDNIVEVLSSAFYLNKISLPEVTREMTAYEVAERMKQFRRENLPLFAPLESEYNGALCEAAFDIALENGLLGSPYDIPESLKGRDVVFRFESPLKDADEEEKEQQFRRTAQLLAEAAQFDPGAVANVDFDTALRDAILGTGSPSRWLRSLETVIDMRTVQAKQQLAQAAMENPEAASQLMH